MIEQQLVELRAGDLVRAIPARPKTVLEIKFHLTRATGRRNLAPVFRNENAVHLLAHSEPIESGKAERQKRFANVKAREFFPLHFPTRRASPRQPCGGGAPAGAA